MHPDTTVAEAPKAKAAASATDKKQAKSKSKPSADDDEEGDGAEEDGGDDDGVTTGTLDDLVIDEPADDADGGAATGADAEANAELLSGDADATPSGMSAEAQALSHELKVEQEVEDFKAQLSNIKAPNVRWNAQHSFAFVCH